jgi:phage baseplate assembly protein gpV
LTTGPARIIILVVKGFPEIGAKEGSPKMKKTVLKGLTALFFVFLTGTLLVSCGPIFNVGGGGGGGNPNPPTTPTPPTTGYQDVRAYDWRDLVDYLQSDEASYNISLGEIDNSNIYLQRNISITRPMRITGNPGKVYTLHSVNREGGNTFYGLDLQADLELQYCGFTGYGGTSGSPPLDIKAGSTLTLGTNSVLELRGGGATTAIRTGSQVKLGEGASIVDDTGDLLFNAGVEKLIIGGRVSLKNKLTVKPNAILQIENGGQLRVEPGATLTLNSGIKELRLNGNIVVDRTTDSVGALVIAGSLESLLEKITGSASLNIENGIADEPATTPFEYGANTIIKLTGHGISMDKRVSSDVGGLVILNGPFTMPKEKILSVGVGMDLNVKNTLTLKGGTLDVAGNVIVSTTGGEIIVNAEDKLNAIPKGSVDIASNGSITIDDGKFTDKSASQDAKIFTFPSYGSGSLIIKDTGQASMGTVVIGGSGPLILDPASTLTIRTASGGVSEFTLRGTGTLTVPSGGLTLEGRFILAASSVLTVTGGGTLTVKAPNQLTGTATPSASQLIVNSGKVEIYTNANSDQPSSILNPKTYLWSGSWD